MTLAKSKLMAFVLTTDATRARAFYEGVLGLRVVGEDPFALVLDANGTKIRVTKMEKWTPNAHTVVGWDVEDVPAAVRALRERGVTLERYDFLEQDELGVWTAPGGAAKVAWFKDPDGNVLSVSQG
jgi:catechol 2,3-dioxygenase-like lactoylglutathione lyase family enzyme